jgi:hypothetical protein
MEGQAWIISEGDTVINESMQLLYRREKLFFMAQPLEQEPVYFEVEDFTNNFFIAANPYNDFPNRIEYRRSGDQMKATISSASRKKDFNFIRK